MLCVILMNISGQMSYLVVNKLFDVTMKCHECHEMFSQCYEMFSEVELFNE